MKKGYVPTVAFAGLAGVFMGCFAAAHDIGWRMADGGARRSVRYCQRLLERDL